MLAKRYRLPVMSALRRFRNVVCVAPCAQGKAGIPSVGVAVLFPECPLCQLHLLLFRKVEEFLGHTKHVVVTEAQGSIDEIGKAGGCENIMKLLGQS